MYAITGITGRIGGQLARLLLAQGKPVRAVLRDPSKVAYWEALGCEIALADITDAPRLADAFRGAEAVFLLVPPIFDPSPGFREARLVCGSFETALETARPDRILYLSTIGARAPHENLLSPHETNERVLEHVNLPTTILRPAWFMENASWDLPSVREQGIIHSFLQPLDRPIPMVATADIASLAAELIQEKITTHRIINLESTRRVSPNDLASTFAELLGKPVHAEAIPRDTWESIFRTQGMNNPAPRIAMLDGFNQGWIDFEDGDKTSRKGPTSLKTVIEDLLIR